MHVHAYHRTITTLHSNRSSSNLQPACRLLVASIALPGLQALQYEPPVKIPGTRVKLSVMESPTVSLVDTSPGCNFGLFHPACTDIMHMRYERFCSHRTCIIHQSDRWSSGRISCCRQLLCINIRRRSAITCRSTHCGKLAPVE
jgi:hypothetical protein